MYMYDKTLKEEHRLRYKICRRNSHINLDPLNPSLPSRRDEKNLNLKVSFSGRVMVVTERTGDEIEVGVLISLFVLQQG